MSTSRCPLSQTPGCRSPIVYLGVGDVNTVLAVLLETAGPCETNKLRRRHNPRADAEYEIGVRGGFFGDAGGGRTFVGSELDFKGPAAAELGRRARVEAEGFLEEPLGARDHDGLAPRTFAQERAGVEPVLAGRHQNLAADRASAKQVPVAWLVPASSRCEPPCAGLEGHLGQRLGPRLDAQGAAPGAPLDRSGRAPV